MKQNNFGRFAWFTLAFNILVILWGAFVRATGSGAGCGAHWPLCNGAVIPRAPQTETIIELIHRATSGLAGLFVLALLIWAFLRYRSGHRIFKAAAVSAVFIVLEALVGAGLVKFEWVANDQSVERVIVIAVHLVNTFILLAALAMTAWWASGGERVVLTGNRSGVTFFVIAFTGLLLIGITGAITALGDTLFPAGSLAEGVAQDFLPTAHFLVRLRVWHPVVAAVVGVYLVILSVTLALFRANPVIQRLAAIMSGLFGVQLIAGLVNLVLLAPVWMQIVHLLLAELVWITLVLLAAANFGESELRQNVEVKVVKSGAQSPSGAA